MEKLINIIEDHALIEEFLLEVRSSIKLGKPLPELVPSLNDTLMMDALGDICEALAAKQPPVLQDNQSCTNAAFL
jgi:hypothetical protein